jgi:uncharacterized repeat protein (TIGR02543 family)
MKRTLKYFIILALAAALCLALASCADEGITVSYYTTEGSEYPSSFTVEADGSFIFEPLTREGYVFNGLYDAQDGGVQIIDENGNANVVIDHSVTLYAQWTPLKYPVLFNAGDGEFTVPAPETMDYGTVFAALPLPTRVGYDFVGWYYADTQITDGTGTALPDAAPFTFDNYPVSAETAVEFTAGWTIKQMTVTFDYNDGSFEKQAVTVNYGDPLPLSAFPAIDNTEEQRETKGWSFAKNTSTLISEDIEAITEDMTFFGIWHDYRVISFVEGENKTELVKVYDDEECTYTPSRAGYEFDGWYGSTSFAGNPEAHIQYASAKDVYYARWLLITYAVTLNYGAPTNYHAYSTTMDIESSLMLPKPSLTNYLFLGWYETTDFSGAPLDSVVADTNATKTYYAKWYNNSPISHNGIWGKTWSTGSTGGTVETNSGAIKITVPDELKKYAAEGKLGVTVTANFTVGVQSMGNATGYATAYLVCNNRAYYAVEKGQKGGGYGGFLWTSPQKGSWGYASGSVTQSFKFASAASSIAVGYEYTMHSDKENNSVTTYLSYECTSLSYQFYIIE